MGLGAEFLIQKKNRARKISKNISADKKQVPQFLFMVAKDIELT